MLILHVSGQTRLMFQRGEAVISSLTLFESMRLPGLSESEEQALRDLMSLCRMISVNDRIAENAAMLGRTHPKKKPIDLLIAATALELCVPVITKNVRDFKGIKNLEVYDHIP